MSNISDTHNIVSYTPTVTKPFSNQRLSVCYWKTGKDGIKKESKCVSIPKIEGITPEELQEFIPSVLELINNTQNKIIRELIENGQTQVSDSEISIKEVIKYINEVGTSDGSARLTKESIGQWFDTSLSDSLMLALSNKLGVGLDVEITRDQEKLVMATLGAFKGKLVSLSGPSVKLDVKTINSLKSAINTIDGDDGMGNRLLSKLDNMLVKLETEVSLFDLL